jgi:hypothetical protein
MGVNEAVTIPAAPRGGRPTLAPTGEPSVKVPGTWLAPDDSERLALLVARFRRRNGGTDADARRAIIRAGIPSIATALDSADSLMVEAVMADRRYNVAREYTGAPEPVPGLEIGQRWVTRFCGAWVGASVTQQDGWLVAVDHYAAHRTR